MLLFYIITIKIDALIPFMHKWINTLIKESGVKLLFFSVDLGPKIPLSNIPIFHGWFHGPPTSDQIPQPYLQMKTLTHAILASFFDEHKFPKYKAHPADSYTRMWTHYTAWYLLLAHYMFVKHINKFRLPFECKDFIISFTSVCPLFRGGSHLCCCVTCMCCCILRLLLLLLLQKILNPVFCFVFTTFTLF